MGNVRIEFHQPTRNKLAPPMGKNRHGEEEFNPPPLRKIRRPKGDLYSDIIFAIPATSPKHDPSVADLVIPPNHVFPPETISFYDLDWREVFAVGARRKQIRAALHFNDLDIPTIDVGKENPKAMGKFAVRQALRRLITAEPSPSDIRTYEALTKLSPLTWKALPGQKLLQELRSIVIWERIQLLFPNVSPYEKKQIAIEWKKRGNFMGIPGFTQEKIKRYLEVWQTKENNRQMIEFFTWLDGITPKIYRAAYKERMLFEPGQTLRQMKSEAQLARRAIVTTIERGTDYMQHPDGWNDIRWPARIVRAHNLLPSHRDNIAARDLAVLLDNIALLHMKERNFLEENLPAIAQALKNRDRALAVSLATDYLRTAYEELPRPKARLILRTVNSMSDVVNYLGAFDRMARYWVQLNLVGIDNLTRNNNRPIRTEAVFDYIVNHASDSGIANQVRAAGKAGAGLYADEFIRPDADGLRRPTPAFMDLVVNAYRALPGNETIDIARNPEAQVEVQLIALDLINQPTRFSREYLQLLADGLLHRPEYRQEDLGSLPEKSDASPSKLLLRVAGVIKTFKDDRTISQFQPGLVTHQIEQFLRAHQWDRKTQLLLQKAMVASDDGTARTLVRQAFESNLRYILRNLGEVSLKDQEKFIKAISAIWIYTNLEGWEAAIGRNASR